MSKIINLKPVSQETKVSAKSVNICLRYSLHRLKIFKVMAELLGIGICLGILNEKARDQNLMYRRLSEMLSVAIRIKKNYLQGEIAGKY